MIVIAYDAQADSNASGGYLLHDTTDTSKGGGFCIFSDRVLNAWGFSPYFQAAGTNPITAVEAAMPLLCVLREARWLRG